MTGGMLSPANCSMNAAGGNWRAATGFPLLRPTMVRTMPPALYCLTLWHTWRWTGDDKLLKAHLETAKAAIRWCDERGDRDRDGLLEYETRSPKGYRNQSWKDAGDAVVHADGRQANLPLATVELQGYLFAAHLAMAELLAAQGEEIDVIEGTVEAPLWGIPPLDQE